MVCEVGADYVMVHLRANTQQTGSQCTPERTRGEAVEVCQDASMARGPTKYRIISCCGVFFCVCVK